MGIIDHVNLPVADLVRARTFYDPVLAALGQQLLAEDGPAVGYGSGTWSFGLIETRPPFPALHLAFAAQSRAEVDAFHAAALAAGGTDNGGVDNTDQRRRDVRQHDGHSDRQHCAVRHDCRVATLTRCCHKSEMLPIPARTAEPGL